MTFIIKVDEMAYHNRNHLEKVRYVMNDYWAWKAKNPDLPDSKYVRSLLPKLLGYPLTYNAFMKGYKHRFQGVKVVKNQLEIF